MDKVTIQRIQLLHPKLRSDVDEIYNEICNVLTGRAICRFSQTLRTYEEQNTLYAQGRTTKGKIVTNAKGGSSYHQFGLAIDVVLIIDGKTASWDTKTDFDKDGKSDWMEVVSIFKKHGWEWGGDFKSIKDYPHFQKTFGYNIKQLQDLHNKQNKLYLDL